MINNEIDFKMNFSFKEYGFETPTFKGEILKKVETFFIGYIIHNCTVLPVKWNTNGSILTRIVDYDYNLIPITKEWDEYKENFPAFIIELYSCERNPSIISVDYYNWYNDDYKQSKVWRLATKEEIEKLYYKDKQ